MNRTTLVISSVIAAAVVALVYVYGSSQPQADAEHASAASKGTQAVDRRLAGTTGTRRSPAEGGAALVKEKARDNPYWAEVFSPNLLPSFRKLATIDDPAAAATAFEISVKCSLYTELMYPRTLEKIERATTKPEVKARQLKVAEEQRRKCAGFTSEDVALGVSRHAYLKERNDPRSAAVNLPFTMPDEAFALAKAAVDLKDPYAIREVGTYFLSRIDLGRNPVYDLGDGLQASPRMMYDAFTLAACAYGGDCGPESTLVTSRCVNAGQCDAGGVEDLLIHYSYSPADAERLLALRQVVATGLESGRWPSSFWVAPRQIPAHLLKK